MTASLLTGFIPSSRWLATLVFIPHCPQTLFNDSVTIAGDVLIIC